MNLTDNPFEPLMKQVPRYSPVRAKQPPSDSICDACSFWQGHVCIGTCYRKLLREGALGQPPNLPDIPCGPEHP